MTAKADTPKPKPKRPPGRPRNVTTVSYEQRFVRCDDCRATGIDLAKLRDGGAKTECPVCQGAGSYLAEQTVRFEARKRLADMLPEGS